MSFFTAHEAEEIAIEGYGLFERFDVLLSMDEVDYNNIENDADLPKKKDTVCLDVASRGNRVNLYSYRDELKDKFLYCPCQRQHPGN